MTNQLKSQTKGSASLVASVLMLASVTAAAQAPPPPPEQPPPSPYQPHPGSMGEAPPPPAPPTVYPSIGPNREMRIMENTWLKFGLQIQMWADSEQSSLVSTGTRGYVNNLFLRRARMLFGAQVIKNVNVFFQTDVPNLGKAAANTASPLKTFGTFILQDAYGEVKFHDAFTVQCGLLIVPLSRQLLASTTTFWTLDIGNTTGTASAPTAEFATRDTGFEFQGFLLEDHFQYRAGVFAGIRNPPLDSGVGSQNTPRFAAYLQYNFFDPEKTTFVYANHNYGKKKIVGVGAGVDVQKGPEHDPYWAASANVFAAWPLSGEASKEGGDEIGGLIQFMHFNGQDTAAIPNQNDILAEVGYYNKEYSFGAFGKFEARLLTDDTAKINGNQLWFGGGFRYYIKENNAQLAIAYNRAQFPEADSNVRKGTNQFTLQMQVYYY